MTLARADTPEETPIDPLIRAMAISQQRTPGLPDPSNRFAGDAIVARFGEKLFFSAKISGNGRACSSCHLGVSLSGRPERGDRSGIPPRDIPSARSTRYYSVFFWDGRADSLWSLAAQVMENRHEFATDIHSIVDRFRHDTELRDEYERIFGHIDDLGDEKVFIDISKALAAFLMERGWCETRFDKYVRQLKSRNRNTFLSPSEIHGLNLFYEKGCVSCHNGPGFTNSAFHNIALPLDRSRPPDTGRYGSLVKGIYRFNNISQFSDVRRKFGSPEFSGNLSDYWGSFRTPSLRAVALTGPYMHDGRFNTLEEVVEYYSTMSGAERDHHSETTLQPLNLSESEKIDLVLFLKTLTPIEPDKYCR